MKQLLILFSLMLIIVVSCKKDEDTSIQYESTGILLGEDIALCACCGGCVLVLDGDSLEYRVNEFPANFTCPNDSTSVKLNWTLENDCSGYQRIIVDDIALN